MQLFQYWYDSFRIFFPKNFKMFGLVTLNTIGVTYKTWVKYFWWLFLVFIGVGIVPDSIKLIVSFYLLFFIIFFGSFIVKFFLLISIFLSLRPSTKKKNFDYYSGYIRHVLWIGLFYTIMIYSFFLISAKGDSFLFEFGFDGRFFPLNIFFPHIIVLMTPLMMFYFDTKGTFKDLFFSGVSTIKMIFYNLPFFIVLVLICMFLSVLVPFSGLYGIVFAVIPASFVANFYTKKLRDQSKLYF